MPIGITVQQPFTKSPLCPTGAHIVALAEIKPYTQKQGYNGKPPEERLIWRFLSSKRDDDGNYYEVPVFTGMRYGNTKAALTRLLNMIYPGIEEMSKEEQAALDLEQFIGEKFRSKVIHEAREGETEKFANFLFLEPLDTAEASQATAEVAADPFATDEKEERDPELGKATCQWKDCHKLLNLPLIEACRKNFGAERYCAEHGKAKMAAAKAEAEALARVEAVERVAEQGHPEEAEMLDPFVTEAVAA